MVAPRVGRLAGDRLATLAGDLLCGEARRDDRLGRSTVDGEMDGDGLLDGRLLRRSRPGWVGAEPTAVLDHDHSLGVAVTPPAGGRRQR